MLYKHILLFFIIYIFTLANFYVIGAETENEYLVLLPGELSKLTSRMQLAAYFETNTAPEIEFFSLTETDEMHRWIVIKSKELSASEFSALQAKGKILYHQINHVFQLHQTAPSDPLYPDQWYHQALGAAKVWPSLPDNQEIIIGVIDTGIEYNHPDLINSIWVNRPEDLNHNGILDAADINGLDDDGNGFIDDVVGWDFTDAPRFRDNGDYLVPDNDPSDEYYNGHGTQIAGIIAAGINNNIGIAGLIPGLKIMNLRAGTANGYLEEDDVARAIFYAVENGARVINMSFGDTEVSRFLSDVLFYAYNQGVVLVASAGNNADNLIHFPAALSETIAIGASDRMQKRAGFSGWGGLLDLVAPGEEILSSSRNAEYNIVQGTSFSAPMVSAAAGMLFQLNEKFSNEDIRHLLKSSARDINVPGWDPYTGAGILDFPRLLEGLSRKSLQINSPAPGTSVASTHIPVNITAKDPIFRHLTLQIGEGEQPAQWKTLIKDYAYQVIRDSITRLDLGSYTDTALVLRLLTEDWRGGTSEFRSLFFIDRSPPLMEDLKMLEMLDGEQRAILIEFKTDDLAQSELFFKPADQLVPFEKRSFRFETREHKIILNRQVIPSEAEFYIQLRNKSGLTTVANNGGFYYRWQLDPDPVWSPDFEQVPWQFPSGFALPFVTDLDKNGLEEVILSYYDMDFLFGPLQIYEFNQDKFELKSETTERMIPRDAGDADGDGLADILAGFGQRTYLLEAETEGSFPVQISWQDTNFWGSRITDLDKDGRFELLGRRENTFVLLEAGGNNLFNEVFIFENLSLGANVLGPPRTAVADFDANGKVEIVYGDYDGDLIIYENSSDNQYRFKNSIRLKFTDATDFFTTLPKPDGHSLLVAGSYASGTDNYEHEFEARYWEYQIFETDGMDGFTEIDGFRINGYHDVRYFDAGITSVDLGAEIMLVCAPHPNIYLMQKHNGQVEPFWMYPEARSNTVITNDFDRNGLPELYFNTGAEFIGIEAIDKPRPPAPANFTVTPIDTEQIFLNWDAVSGADYYVIYRGGSQQALQPLDSIYNDSQYYDVNLTTDQVYLYAIQTISSLFTQKRSPLSRKISARPNQPPEIDTLTVINDNQLKITFSEPMLSVSLIEDNFRLMPDDLSPHSVVPFRNAQSVLVTFDQTFDARIDYYLYVGHVRDADRTFITGGKQIVGFRFEQTQRPPYIKKWYLENRRRLIVEFNVPMDVSTVLNPDNYQLHPSGKVLGIDVRDSEGCQFSLSTIF